MSAEAPWLRHLPNGKAISALGFGCSSMWAKPGFDAAQAQSVLATSLAEGVNHFDTSPSYGAGHGEARLAAFLRDRDPKPLVLSTKVGSNLIDGGVFRGFGGDLIRRSFDASLARLGLDHVDILYLHGPSEADLSDTVLRFFEEQKAAGRISYAGVNSFDAPVLARCAALPIDAVMLQYNVGDFRLAESMRLLHASGRIVISGTALARAQFDWRTFVPRDAASAWYLARMLRHDPRFLQKGRRLAQRLAKIDDLPHATAIRFVVGEPQILSNLFGTTKADHAAANARAGHRPLGPAERRLLST